MTNFGITHVLLACYVRALCKYPALNRFISGQKVYSRGRYPILPMTIKKEMTSSSSRLRSSKVHLILGTLPRTYTESLQMLSMREKHPLDSNFDNTADALT